MKNEKVFVGKKLQNHDKALFARFTKVGTMHFGKRDLNEYSSNV